ncbi:MAG: methylisocitrate lyase [Phycisphaerales bacterium JB063]
MPQRNHNTTATPSPGQRLRDALATETPLQVPGVINAYCALLAERAGFSALYLSGAGVANASFGWPDLGYTTLENVAEDARRITQTTTLPLLVDADTGFNDPGETANAFIDAGVAGMHLEDQVEQKRCGHRPGKQLVPTQVMCDRVRAAVTARQDPAFVVMARTDAHTVEGLDAAIDRATAYAEAGADMIFAEALATLDEFRRFVDAVQVPVLANITEFGKTPGFTVEELRTAGVSLALYPLTAFRAMSFTATQAYHTLRTEGTQRAMLDLMQTREQLYDVLRYHEHEQRLDQQLSSEGANDG